MKTVNELIQTNNLLIERTTNDGGCGEMWKAGRPFGSVVWSFDGGWEHVSLAPYRHSYTPSWEDMCRLKEMFFYDDETVVQYHPAEADYINNVENCLHIWRPLREKLPTPPTFMVGLRAGQTVENAYREAAEHGC